MTVSGVVYKLPICDILSSHDYDSGIEPKYCIVAHTQGIEGGIFST